MPKAKIAVIGAGRMGHGIAQIFAAAGHEVALQDPAANILAAAPAQIRSIFELLGQEAGNVELVSLHGGLPEAVADAEIVIEAAPEKLELKQQIFAELEASTGADTILASNTSGIPIGQIGAKVANRERVIGTHFWNPPHLIPLVEVVQAEETSPDVVARILRLLNSVGKSAVHVKHDIPGFIGNRLQHALKREAIALVEAGVCDAETVDQVVRDGFGMRLAVMGPLENSDLIGLNLTLDVHEVLLQDLDRSTAPQKLLLDKVAAGDLGMSAGRGFRDWTPEEAEAARRRMNDYLVELARSRLKNQE